MPGVALGGVLTATVTPPANQPTAPTALDPDPELGNIRKKDFQIKDMLGLSKRDMIGFHALHTAQGERQQIC